MNYRLKLLQKLISEQVTAGPASLPLCHLQPVLHCPDLWAMTYFFEGLKMLSLTFEVTNDVSLY